jgi:heme-degrading monooxygenase HmoA
VPIEHDAIPAGPGLPVVVVTTIQGSPENLERALPLVRGQLLAVLQGQPGWQGALGLVSFDRSRSLVLSFWESEAASREGAAVAAGFRERAAAAGLTITSSDRLEIAFDERAG